MTGRDLIPQLYRQEYSKMVSLLCNRFGIDKIDAAEDIVSETFLSAAETWGMKGIPCDPVAWLYAVARNNALNGLKHEKVVRRYEKDAVRQQEAGAGPAGPRIEPDWDVSAEGITDSQLRMLFAVCHPAIPMEAQVSLALRVLCGFTIEEIAQALLTTKATINKRLYRAKSTLREEAIFLEVPVGEAFDARLDAVLLTLYLLFNEGYYSGNPSMVLRKDLCLEAMRLCYLMTARDGFVRADVYSLLALMCFQASRFDARFDATGGLVPYEQQDPARWDDELINRGNYFLVQGCERGLPSRYHFEAAIAWWHTHPADESEKWTNILMLYNQLLILQYSPVAALNRAYAFSRVYGKSAAIPEAEGLGLEGNLFYHSLLGELYTGVDEVHAIAHFEQALMLAGTDAEKALLRGKLAACKTRSG
ncbi:MAG TPA: sigma-70 family RNA polymerase sigma factor [Puia sp.]|jgi:RNA polymerase sigma-70 factor (ECF subfamily)